MEKINIKLWEDEEVETKIMRCMAGINELVEGYNELKEKLNVQENKEKCG